MRTLAMLSALLLAASAARAENATTPGEVTTPFPTIVHLAVEWKIAGDDNENAACAVRFRETGAADWRDGMPLRRVPAGKSKGTNPIFSWENKLSGSLFGLKPDTEYEIELKLSDPDGGSAEKTVKARTRPVPRPGPNCETIELPAGEHDELVCASGTPERPKHYVSRDGKAVYKRVRMANVKHVFVTGLTVRNTGRDAGLKAFVMQGAEDCAVMRCKIEAVYGITAYKPGMTNCYIADNEITGIFAWDTKIMGASGKTDGEGIEITGSGNVICHNKVSGFRDCLSHMEDDGTAPQICNDWYENDVYLGLDDGIEADFAFSNCRILRNRLTNCFVGLSSQPGLGGPTYFIRNVMYNLTYAPFKLHRFSEGDVILHNTVVKPGDGLACFAGEPFDHALFRNNLCIGGPDGGQKWGGYGCGSGKALVLNAVGPHSDIDYDGVGTFKTPFSIYVGKLMRASSLEEMRKGPYERHGVQVEMNVFKDAAFPEEPAKEYAPPDLRLAAGSAAIDAAQPIPNINDGFAGQAPDLGAYEFGQDLPRYGPRPEGEDEATEYARRAAPKSAEHPNESAKPAAAAPAPAIDPAPHREALVKALAAAKPGKVYLKVMGQGQEVAFKSADAVGLKVDVQGNTLPLCWKDLGAEDLAQMALRLLSADPEALAHAHALALAEKNEALAQKISDRQSELKSGQ
ncbi:MAG: right-handed parallel beta-helix repeat-containing protein [Planctomycetota bacterium]|nr:right-handed parallel beta-helix repeat-containing protein [Planctomycetota bacterium]